MVRIIKLLSFFSVLMVASLILGGMGLSEAEAVKLRRPFDGNIPFNYGYDNNGSAAGCLDYNCGSICYDGHTGTDFPLVVGTTIRAGEKGTVVATYNGCANYGHYGNTCGGRCGNYVRIRHPDGEETIYCHMRLNSLTVSNGQTVECGQKIGESASSGSSTGPHLHVGWRRSGAYRDLYKGSCGSSVSAWREQRGYREAVGTSCGCVPGPEVCDGKDNDCNGLIDDGDVCEIDYLDESPNSYAQPLTTDINGDGLQDACGRFPEGWGCYLATGDGWGEFIALDYFKDADGWSRPMYYATLRTGDVDGDGLADVCARHSTRGYRCWRSTGTGFEHFADLAGFTNADGWSKPEYYTTFRLADINGDGRDDICARGPDGWFCHLSTGDGFGEKIQGPAWRDASGYARAHYYGTIRTGDLNGDGKQDVCIRRAAGVDCFLSTGTKFERFGLLEDFSNDGGWTEMKYWSTLRLVDFNGDGRADVCARFYSRLRCYPSTEAGFGSPVDILELSSGHGWDDPTTYPSLRIGDISGDGAQDFCFRSNEGLRCYGIESGEQFAVTGPEWSDASGWSRPEYFNTVMVTDIDHDRRRDVCARGSAGLRCAVRTDTGFRGLPILDAFSNANGWNKPEYYSTLRMGQGVCRPELCNGFDDSCNGKIDDGAPQVMGPVPPKYAARFAGSEFPEESQTGQVVDVTVSFENMGFKTWQPDEIILQAVATDPAKLAAIRPEGQWFDEAIAAALSEAAAPGEIGRFSFPVKVPEESSIFEDILFVLGTTEEPIVCPSPSTILTPGVVLDPGPVNPGGPGGPAGPGQPGGEPGDGDNDGDGDELESEQSMMTASTSSCSATGSSRQGPSVFFVFIGVIGLMRVYRRRKGGFGERKTSVHAKTAALLSALFVLGACEKQDIQGFGEAPTQLDQALEFGESERAENEEEAEYTPPIDFSPQLLAIYGDWELQGKLLPLPPRSDAVAQFEVTLLFKGEEQPWPLKETTITGASFIPGGEIPSLVALSPVGVVFHVDLAAGTATPIDEQAGTMVAVSANGCCAAYMKGEMGFFEVLKVVDFSEGTARELDLAQNSWAPALSPGGDKVVYVAPTDSGQTGIYGLDLQEQEPKPELLTVEPIAFPTGPQPPVWTKDGIYFSSERGAYLMSPDAQDFKAISGFSEILVDLKTGAVMTPKGERLRF